MEGDNTINTTPQPDVHEQINDKRGRPRLYSNFEESESVNYKIQKSRR